MKTAYVFPGQGSQFVGMGAGLDDSYFEMAGAALGFTLSGCAWKAPKRHCGGPIFSSPPFLPSAPPPSQNWAKNRMPSRGIVWGNIPPSSRPAPSHSGMA